MIVVRTPLRISLAGGGTDLPIWYKKHGSMFISAAIDKYIYTILHKPFENKIFLHYSETEEVEKIKDIKNDIIRATFQEYGIEKPIEITTLADIPSGTGLGSSGSFGVGLIHALRPNSSKDFLAMWASIVQILNLRYPIGSQDQYVAAYGGINIYNISKQGIIKIHPFKLDYKKLQKKLVMFFTGVKRDTNDILKKSSTDGLDFIQDLAHEIGDALQDNKFDLFGKLLNEHWQYKKQRGGMTNPEIDKYYELGLKNGALGGKLIGAGGGGFLLFYTNDREKLIKNMPLRYQPFNWDFEGSKIIYEDIS